MPLAWAANSGEGDRSRSGDWLVVVVSDTGFLLGRAEDIDGLRPPANPHHPRHCKGSGRRGRPTGRWARRAANLCAVTDTSRTATTSSRERRHTPRPARPPWRGPGAPRVRAPGGGLLGALLWWPVGFLGQESWLHLPLVVFDGDVLFLGATAAAASVSLVVRSPWPRFAIVAAFSAPRLGPGRPHQRGVPARARGAGGPARWWGPARGPARRAGGQGRPRRGDRPRRGRRALPRRRGRADWRSPGPGPALRGGDLATGRADRAEPAAARPDLARPRSGGQGAVLRLGPRSGPAAVVFPSASRRAPWPTPSWDFARTQWWHYTQALLTSSTRWFVVAAVLAGGIIVVRAASRRTAPRRCHVLSRCTWLRPTRSGGAERTPGERLPAVGDVDHQSAGGAVVEREDPERQSRPHSETHRGVPSKDPAQATWRKVV